MEIWDEELALHELVPEAFWERLISDPPPYERALRLEIVPAGRRACVLECGDTIVQDSDDAIPQDALRCWDGPIEVVGCTEASGDGVCVWQEPDPARAGYCPEG